MSVWGVCKCIIMLYRVCHHFIASRVCTFPCSFCFPEHFVLSFFFFPINTTSLPSAIALKLNYHFQFLFSPLLLTANLAWIMMRFFVDNFLSDNFHTWHLCVHWLILGVFFKALKRERRWFKFKLDKKRKRELSMYKKKVFK